MAFHSSSLPPSKFFLLPWEGNVNIIPHRSYFPTFLLLSLEDRRRRLSHEQIHKASLHTARFPFRMTVSLSFFPLFFCR